MRDDERGVWLQNDDLLANVNNIPFESYPSRNRLDDFDVIVDGRNEVVFLAWCPLLRNDHQKNKGSGHRSYNNPTYLSVSTFRQLPIGQ